MPVPIIDTHCHYNLSPLHETWNDHWHAAQEQGVTHAVVIGTDIVASHSAVAIAQAEPHLKAAIGIHPNELDQLTSEDELAATLDLYHSELATLVRDPHVVAIGETGLDYFHLPEDTGRHAFIKHAQQESFRLHIDLAQHHGLPLIIHVRDRQAEAYQDVLRLLRAHHLGNQPFILHCISGTTEYLTEALSLGATIGVAGNVTYKTAEPIRDLVRATPPDRLVTETDAPYLPPQGYRGKPCQPWMIADTVRFLQQELNLDPTQLYANAERLFFQRGT